MSQSAPQNAPSFQARQGDILITPVDKIPTKAKDTPREAGAVVLAHGSATDHYHAIRDASATLTEKGEKRFLRVGETGAELVHDEHSTIAIPAGEYAVIRQQEWADESIHQVED